jgi:hypothetical protein
LNKKDDDPDDRAAARRESWIRRRPPHSNNIRVVTTETPYRRKVKTTITKEATVVVEAEDGQVAIEELLEERDFVRSLDWKEVDREDHEDDRGNFETFIQTVAATNVDDPTDEVESYREGELL